MSCHNIGHGINTIVEVVIELFDDKKISLDVAKKIIFACRNGVNWCDGNEHESIECIHNRCGHCLKEMKDGDYFFDMLSLDYLESVDFETSRKNAIEMIDNELDPLATFGMCKKCFMEVCDKYYNQKGIGKKII